MGAAGRRGASPGFICAPLGTIFSTFVGSPGARIGFSGTMDLRKLDWRFKRSPTFTQRPQFFAVNSRGLFRGRRQWPQASQSADPGRGAAWAAMTSPAFEARVVDK